MLGELVFQALDARLQGAHDCRQVGETRHNGLFALSVQLAHFI